MQKLDRYVNEFFKQIGDSEDGYSVYQNFLECISKGNLYHQSAFNQIMIFMQRPEAEIVSDYSGWTSTGYVIKKGSAIYTAGNTDYLFDEKSILNLSYEEKQQFLWEIGDFRLYDYINETFVEKKDTFEQSVENIATVYLNSTVQPPLDMAEQSEKIFQFAKEAAEYIILTRCGCTCDFSKELKEYFNFLDGESRRKVIESMQEPVQQISDIVLHNISRLVAYRRENRDNDRQEYREAEYGNTSGAGTGGSGERATDTGTVDTDADRGARKTDSQLAEGGVQEQLPVLAAAGTGMGDRREQNPGSRKVQSEDNRGERKGIFDPAAVKEEARVRGKQKRIDDFGEKIGGARKDLWKSRGLTLNDLFDMNEKERKKYVAKNYIWKKPDYMALSETIPIRVVYFYKVMRDAAPVSPETEESQERYIGFMNELRDNVLSCKTENDIRNFFQRFFADQGYVSVSGYRAAVTEKGKGLVTGKLVNASIVSPYSLIKYDREIKKKQFCYSEEEKLLAGYEFMKYDPDRFSFEKDYAGTTLLILNLPNGRRYYYPKNDLEAKEKWIPDTYFLVTGSHCVLMNNFDTIESAKAYAKERVLANQAENVKDRTKRKQKFVPEQLKNIKREGLEDVRKGADIIGERYLEEFGFRGGEFGNWMSENDRQESLNMGYEALCDLADALQIEKRDIALGGSLAIAFGARGRGNAMAHYEPMQEVINLTKMRGAGSLAHEWGHAFDYNNRERLTKEEYDRIFEPLIDMLKYEYVTGPSGEKRRINTNFYNNSRKMDQLYSKCDKGYWHSDEEMFARAFACYVDDKIMDKGGRSDYLCGHAESAISVDSTGEVIVAVPEGEERKRFNQSFDKMIGQLKEKGLLHDQTESKDVVEKKEKSKTSRLL